MHGERSSPSYTDKNILCISRWHNKIILRSAYYCSILKVKWYPGIYKLKSTKGYWIIYSSSPVSSIWSTSWKAFRLESEMDYCLLAAKYLNKQHGSLLCFNSTHILWALTIRSKKKSTGTSSIPWLLVRREQSFSFVFPAYEGSFFQDCHEVFVKLLH